MMSMLISALLVKRPLPVLIAVSLALSLLHVFAILPVSLITGASHFWDYPSGIMGSNTDMAQVLVGYLYLQQSRWVFPILFVPNLGSPIGANIFWLDAVPWLSLAGKMAFSLTGTPINLLGFYLCACLLLPGIAMTTLLAVAGQGCLAAAIAGTALANAMPYLLYRWGHIASFGQFWIVFSLVLYFLTVRNPRDVRYAVTWLGLLPLVFLSNMYLFVMSGAIWTAALTQRWLDRTASPARVFKELAVTLGMVTCVALITGILSSDLGSAGSGGFGAYSMNLVSPIVPQMSGLIRPLINYRVGMGTQIEGFAYLGAGALLLLAVTLPAWVNWIRWHAGSHIVLISMLFCFLCFALSNKVYIGSHLIMEIPLPEPLVRALGTFRSGGRFFWPIGYVLVAGSILLALRHFRPSAKVTVLAAAAALQVVDVGPLRDAIAATAARSYPAIFDRQQATSLVARSQAVTVFPTIGCADEQWVQRLVSQTEWSRLQQANMEFQLITARANLPINSVYNARLKTDCAAEDQLQHQSLRRGTLYVYLTDFTPTADQLGGRSPDDVCAKLDWLRYCLIPTPAR